MSGPFAGSARGIPYMNARAISRQPRSFGASSAQWSCSDSPIRRTHMSHLDSSIIKLEW